MINVHIHTARSTDLIIPIVLVTDDQPVELTCDVINAPVPVY
jgi:hypothetical protein